VPRTSKPTLRVSDSYKPFPRQEEFHKSHAKYRLFGGAAGPGKTKALLWEAIRQARDVPGSDSLLLRRTYPELESSLLAIGITLYANPLHTCTKIWRKGSAAPLVSA